LRVLYRVYNLFGPVEIRTQPLSYSVLSGIWAISSSQREKLFDLQTRPGYVSGLSSQSSFVSRHSGDVVPEENLPDT